MIPQETIERIFDAASIVDIVGEAVTLKKSGVNLTACCPFHDEKTPSFVVSPVKNIYKCFGCGEAGGPISFLQKNNGLSYPEALKYLAKKYQIEIKEEKPDPEAKKKTDLREQIHHLNKLAARHFYENLWKPENALALKYALSRFTKEELIQNGIGFAADSFNDLLDAFKKAGVKEEFSLLSSLIRESEKSGKQYDFFRNRLIFPIIHNENVKAFGGRILPGGEGAKYLNSADTPAYDKSRTLYGLNLAAKAIRQKDNCHIVEGYTDVVRMQGKDILNTVAPCGTALTIPQLKLIQRYTKTLTLVYDGDNAGRKAADKNGKLAIEQGFNVYIALLPDGEDPDSYFTSEKIFNQFVEANKKDFILTKSTILFETAGNDPALRHYAINDICNLLANQDKSKQEIYIEEICKTTKQKAKLFQEKIKDLNREGSAATETKEWLPSDVDPNAFEKWGFYEYNNQYNFRGKAGIEALSNFVMKPIFHITSIFDSRRIFELFNVHGHRVVINLDMQMVTSLQAFQKEIESRGNFLFWGSMVHLQKIKLKLYEETRTCEEIKNLGWQKEGFWAWSNGMINEDGSFQEVDEYGVVKHNDDNYFIPAFSKIYINDKSVFLDERKFQYKPGKITINEWTALYTKVHGENSMIGFAFYIAALFRDHLLYLFDNFPILNLFGPKGSGKNTMAYSLLSLFGKKQTEFNIHNGTKPGLAKHLELFSNAIAFIDEYKNNLDFDKIETLKAIYNAIGRSRMNMDKGGKKETTAVNQAVILAGQEMPTIDVALSSRVIFLQFLSKKGLSKEAKADFEKLQKIERDGLPHISVAFLKQRKYFIDNFKNNYDQVLQDFMANIDKNQLDDRILRNMVTVCSAFKTLATKFDFSFSYDDLKQKGIEVIKNHNDQLTRSDEIGVFWSLMEALFDENDLIDKWHFRVKMITELNTTKGKMNFETGKVVLKFKFSSISKLYSEHLRRRGDKPLPIDSLRYYLETSKAFIGVEKSCQFIRKDWDPTESKRREQKQITTAYCFDYSLLNINLERSDIESYDPPEALKSNGQDSIEDVKQLQMVIAPEDKLPF